MAETRDAATPIWMPVFAVSEAIEASPQVAAHPSHLGSLRAQEPALSRSDTAAPQVGTAIRQDDGSYRIQLTALPLNGVLILRLPGPEDGLHRSYGERTR
jgi:hypothetical protein